MGEEISGGSKDSEIAEESFKDSKTTSSGQFVCDFYVFGKAKQG